MKKKMNDVDLKPFEIFNYKDYLSIVKNLSSLISFAEKPILQKEALSLKQLVKIDSANVCMVIALSDRAKDVLRLFINCDSNIEKIPDLSFYEKNENVLCSSRFSVHYLTVIIKFFDYENDSLRISLKNDYPVKIENKDFAFILAPRVDGE